MKAIIATYKRMVKEKDSAQSLPGLSHFTHEQLMVIHAAQVKDPLSPQWFMADYYYSDVLFSIFSLFVIR